MAEKRKRPGLVRRFFPSTLSARQRRTQLVKRERAQQRLSELGEKWGGLAEAPKEASRNIFIGRYGRGGRGRPVSMGSPVDLLRRRLSRDIRRAGQDLERIDRRIAGDRRTSRRRKMLIGGVIAAPLLYAGAFKTRAGRELVGRAVMGANPLKPVAHLMRKGQERANQNIVAAVKRFGETKVQPRAKGLVRKGFGKLLGESADVPGSEGIPGGRFKPGLIERFDARLLDYIVKKGSKVPGLKRIVRRIRPDARSFGDSPVSAERSFRAYTADVAKRGQSVMTEAGAVGRDTSRHARSGEGSVRQLPRGRIGGQPMRKRPSRQEFLERRERAKNAPRITSDVELSIERAVRAKGSYRPRPPARAPKLGELVTPGGHYERRTRLRSRVVRPKGTAMKATPAREHAILEELRRRGPSATIPKDILRKYNTTSREVADMQLRAMKRKRGKA